MWAKILLLMTTTVVGIKEVDIENYPFQVSLEKDGIHSCGGTMIQSHVILTAEHCVFGFPKENLRVRAGTSIRETDGQVRGVKDMHEHPDYNPSTFENDIAILELDSPFDFSLVSSPLDLLHKNNAVANDVFGSVIGWGISSSQGGIPSPVLKIVELPLVSDDKCAEVYIHFNATTMICFGGNGGGDSCLSDSGGPILVWGIKNRMEQVGIVSYGIGCGVIGKPGVYTRVAAFHDFIEKYVWEA